jgi:uncharacterized protein YmfQ (DUF2313 family)
MRPPLKAPKPTFDEWLSATFDLLPQGLAWTREKASNLGKLLSVFAEERRLRHERALILLEIESFPSFSVELLEEWERAVGLPDPCRAAPGTLSERHSELIDRWFSDHVPTPELMVALAAQAGWNITIREQLDFVAGISLAGQPVGESDFVWIVTVLDQVRTYFRAGQSTSGDPLWTYPDLSTLECVLRRANPGHLQLYFIVPP